jgi:hypothetical protein
MEVSICCFSVVWHDAFVFVQDIMQIYKQPCESLEPLLCLAASPSPAKKLVEWCSCSSEEDSHQLM